jgi:hypothetical protein
MSQDKKDLIGRIKALLNQEELIIPIYMEHLNSAVFWVGMPEKDEKMAKGIIQVLLNDSNKHKDMLTKLLERVEKGL